MLQESKTCVSTLKEGEIFFGIIEKDGNRSSAVKRQPTESELKALWEKYPELFSRTCECGHKAYIYSHIIEAKGKTVSKIMSLWQYLRVPHS